MCGDVCASGCQFTTVQAAIDATAAGSIVRICSGTYASIAINKNLTLIGAGSGDDGSILDGRGEGPVVEVGLGITAGLQALQITGGAASELGGGVYTSGNATLTDCLVTGNQARECAGILNVGNLSLVGSDVTSNIAEGDGGGICSLNAGTVALQGSTVRENTAGGSGGGIFNGGISVTLDDQSSVEDNHPDNCAGNPVANCDG